MKRITLSTAARWRWQVAARTLAGVGGGYVLAALSTIDLALLGVAGGMERTDATIMATLLSFVVYCCAVIWAFGAASVTRVWCGLALATLPLVLVKYASVASGATGAVGPGAGIASLAAVALIFAGMMALAVTMTRHERQVGGLPLWWPSGVLAGRVCGYLLLALAWMVCACAWGAASGSAAWCGLLGVGAVLTALTLAYLPLRACRLALVALLIGAMALLL